MKKKPNYKLRRKIALYILIVIILIPILIANRVKIMNLTLYIPNIKYSSVLNSMFEIGYTKDEAKSTINSLKEKNKINKNTTNYILKVHDLGYSNDVVDYVIRNLNKDQMTDFLARKYNKDFEKYIKNNLFDYKNYDRYIKYHKKHKKLKLDDVVTRIALNLDKTYYDDSVLIKNPDEITVLANKYFEIPEDYEPSDLVEMDDDYANNTYSTKKLRKEAYDKFVKMCDASRKSGVKFYAESAYRSFEYQNSLYKEYVRNHGSEEANKYAAKPGFSEHELGLAIDLANIWTITTKGEEYAWLTKHAHEYGYIIRYKEEWEDVTGYAAESWHIRYVGVKVATEVRKKNIPYEEYYIKYIANKSKKN